MSCDFGYLERFRKTFPVTPAFFQELVKRFRAEAPQLQRQPHYFNFQKVLELCSDRISLYRGWLAVCAITTFSGGRVVCFPFILSFLGFP